MRRIRTAAAGLAVAAGLVAMSAGVADAAPATARPTVAPGQYATWPAAQKAAGFHLYKPENTYGLKRRGKVIVGKCPGSKYVKKGTPQVLALYEGSTRIVELLQVKAAHSCVPVPKTRLVGKYKVNGSSARLGRFCGARNAPPCSSSVQFLVLTWAKRGHSYLVITIGVTRTHILGFARGLVAVK